MYRQLHLISCRIASKPLPWVLLASAVFLYFELFIGPGTPIFHGADQMIFLAHARRMLMGQMIYRDFFEFVFPGTTLVNLAFFKVFGVHAWIPNVILIGLGLGLLLASIAISKTVIRGNAAYLPGLLFLVLAYRFFLNSTHHWYSILASMAAVLVVIERRNTARLAAAGALCGLAAWFTQSRGLMAALGLAAVLVWEKYHKRYSTKELLKREITLLAAFLIVVVAGSLYFVWQAGLTKFIEQTLVYPIKYFPGVSYNNLSAYMLQRPPYPSPRGVPVWGAWLAIHALLPLIYLLFFARASREMNARPQEPWDRLMLLNFVGLFLFLGIAASPSWFRLCAVSPPVLVLSLWYIDSFKKLRAFIIPVLWIITATFMVVVPWQTQNHWVGFLDTATGRMGYSDHLAYDKHRWVQQHTQPGDYFYGSVYPDYYFTLGLLNPTEVPFITQTAYTRPEQVRNVVESLDQHRVRFILWWVNLDVPEDSTGADDHLGPLRAYLRRHYRVVKTFPGGDQVWERNE